MKKIEIDIELIKSTPNDMELGNKVRELYNQLNNGKEDNSK